MSVCVCVCVCVCACVRACVRVRVRVCRVYLQLCVDDLTIISPSAAMSRCLMEDRPTDRESAKRPRAAERPLTPAACVSLLLRLESKQGVTLQNGSAAELRLQPGFVCRAVCLGDAQSWSHDPRNHRPQERERHGDAQKVSSTASNTESPTVIFRTVHLSRSSAHADISLA